MEDELDDTLIDNSQIFSQIILFTPELEVLPKEERVKFRKVMRKKKEFYNMLIDWPFFYYCSGQAKLLIGV